MSLSKVIAIINKESPRFYSDCEDNCCNSKKHLIFVNEESLEEFTKKGIKVVNLTEVNQDSVKRWIKSHYIKEILTTKNIPLKNLY